MDRSWKYYRFFEILPGVLVWTILITPIFLSIFRPEILAVALLFFVTFWLVRTFYMSYRLILGYKNYKKDTSTNWLHKLEQMAPEDAWRDIYHIVIVPTYGEDISILDHSIRSVVNSNYPNDRIIYVLATEERDKENGIKHAKTLEKKYGKELFMYRSFVHPKDVPGEVVGKGPNINFSGKAMVPIIKKLKIPFENVIVTNMDADHVMDKNYLPCLTHKYVRDPDPVHKSFQPLPMFFNNIWDVPMATRLIAMGSSAWQMIVSTRPSRLRNFSAHAQSLEALVRVNFWSKTSIVEDGHQFWRSFYKFNGRHDVVPMYTPIYQDAVLGHDLKDTLKEQYLQKKRWAWGVSDIPYVMEHTFKDKKIHWFDRWTNAMILWEAHLSWSTVSLLLATASWLPLVLNPDFKITVMAFFFQIVYSRLLIVAWIGMIITLTITTLLVPTKGGKKPVKRIIWDWILTPIMLPITNILFSSIPALESQSRLMTGKYLDVFRVTPKSTRRTGVDEF